MLLCTAFIDAGTAPGYQKGYVSIQGFCCSGDNSSERTEICFVGQGIGMNIVTLNIPFAALEIVVAEARRTSAILDLSGAGAEKIKNDFNKEKQAFDDVSTKYFRMIDLYDRNGYKFRHFQPQQA